MSILFVGGFFPRDQRAEIIANSRGVIQYAADALQWSFIDGLKEYFTNKLSLINLPYIGSYPLLYKKMRIPKSTFGRDEQLNGISPNFSNLILYKNYSRFVNLKKETLKWVKECDQNRVILVYAVHLPFLKAVSQVKNDFPDIKIILIVPDLPEFMSDSKSPLYQLLKTISNIELKKIYNSVDGFVLLTKYMVERILIGAKPYVVVEGIFNPKDDVIEKNIECSNFKTIFYSGTLAKRYGVLTLVNAFTKLTNDKYRLVICGNGDSLQEILEISKKDKRITYLGQIERKQVLELQRKADLLVNPRSNEGIFTRYSFPSKTMEFLASATPTLLCKLPGIPDEYYDYCFSIDKMDEDNLHRKMNDILSMDKEELSFLGNAARRFVIQEKNPSVQCAKVVDLIHQLNY